MLVFSKETRSPGNEVGQNILTRPMTLGSTKLLVFTFGYTKIMMSCICSHMSYFILFSPFTPENMQTTTAVLEYTKGLIDIPNDQFNGKL